MHHVKSGDVQCVGCKKIRTVIATGANGADPGDYSGAGFPQEKGDSVRPAKEAFGIITTK